VQSDITGDVIGRALAEDLGTGDVTTAAVVPDDLELAADVVVKAPGVICGMSELIACVRLLDPGAEMEPLAAEGDLIAAPPFTVARLHAKAAALLSAERTGLNLVQRMSGIATARRCAAPASRSSTRERLRPASGSWTSAPSRAAAVETTGWASTTPS